MAPGTNIGAAHPVAIGAQKMDKDMSAKVVNDMAAYVRSLAADRGRNAEWAEKAVRQSVSIPAAEALKLKVVDLFADDLPDLLKKIDGRVVRLNQMSRTLKTAKATSRSPDGRVAPSGVKPAGRPEHSHDFHDDRAGRSLF